MVLQIYYQFIVGEYEIRQNPCNFVCVKLQIIVIRCVWVVLVQNGSNFPIHVAVFQTQRNG